MRIISAVVRERREERRRDVVASILAVEAWTLGERCAVTPGANFERKCNGKEVASTERTE
jgi:hypothetical protein